MRDIPEYFNVHQEPTAADEAVVEVPEARFSMLTSRFIRMEYSPENRFEDRPSQVFWLRQQPVPPFHVKCDKTRLEIGTPPLRLSYQIGQPFKDEDDEEGTTYLHGAYAVTPYELEWRDQQLIFHALPVEGDVQKVPARRRLDFVFLGFQQSQKIQITRNEEEVPVQSKHDGGTGKLALPGLEVSPRDHLVIHLSKEGPTLQLEGDFRLPRCQ